MLGGIPPLASYVRSVLTEKIFDLLRAVYRRPATYRSRVKFDPEPVERTISRFAESHAPHRWLTRSPRVSIERLHSEQEIHVVITFYPRDTERMIMSIVLTECTIFDY